MRIFVSIFIFAIFLACRAEDSAPASGGGDGQEPPKKRTVVVKREAPKEMKYRLIPLESLDYDTVERVCRPWISDGGTMIYEKARKSVLLYDTPEVAAKVADFVAKADSGPVNIRIEVDYVGTTLNNNDLIRVDVDSGLPSHQKLLWENGKFVRPSRINVDAKLNSDSRSNLDSMILVTGNGLPATLWVGKTILDPTWLRAQKLIPDTYVVVPGGGSLHIPGSEIDFKWADVGAKLMLTPFYQEATGNVTLELYPVLSFLDGKGKEEAVKVESMSTKVTVKEGQRVYLGGLVSGNKNDYFNLFGPEFFRRDNSSGALDMYVTCHALKPGDRRNSKPSLRQIERENPMDNFRR